jgi:hypothetical protein
MYCKYILEMRAEVGAPMAKMFVENVTELEIILF